MKKLVVCEKNIAANRISFILSNGKAKREYINRIPVYHFSRDGEDFTVIGLRGHIIRLDYSKEYGDWKKNNLIDLIFAKPEKEVMAKGIVNALKKFALESDEAIIATDYDREGELIGVEALDFIKEVKPQITIKRARFSSMTRTELESAFKNLKEVDYALSRSAESRQIIDLAWGASLTRFISLASNQLGRDFLSVGRVQSPTLALLVDRDRKIRDFRPEPFWQIIANLRKSFSFEAKHSHGIFKDEKKVKEVFDRVKNGKVANVLSIIKEQKEERPPAPFNTTSFLAEANKIGFSTSRAMKIAEDLYTNGWISYPRTDNTVYPKSLYLKGVLKALIKSDFSKEVEEIISQPVIRPTRGRFEATDHPPIYPVKGAKKEQLEGKWEIYELVVRRFLSTLAPNALSETTKVDLDIKAEEFIAQGYRILEMGWRKYYPYYKVKESLLPALDKGEEIAVLKIKIEKKSTKPPGRYSQGSLIREMERLNLGTKSTRHEIIQKLYDRNYVTGNNLIPTDVGRAVITALEDNADKITKAEMTSLLEKDMLGIANKEKRQDQVINESQQMLKDIMLILQKNEEKIGKQIVDALKKQNCIGKCRCGGDLLILTSKKGNRFIGCSNYPNCDVTFSLPNMGTIIPTGKNCKICKLPLIKIKIGRLSKTECVDRKCSFNKEASIVGKCNVCGGDLIVRHSKNGKRFIGCLNYPKCTNSYPLPQKGKLVLTDMVCKTCKSPVVTIISKGRSPWYLCINPDCPEKPRRNNIKAN